MLDVRRLRVLLAVRDHGSVAAAAHALSFTPPAVSQQVAALERQLGVTLLDRTGRRARLTSAGERLARHAERVLAQLEAAEADLAAADGPVRGVLRVGAMPSLARAVLPATLRRLRSGTPDLDLRVEQLEPGESLRALRRGDLDVVLAGEYHVTRRPRVPEFERHHLWTEEVLIAVPADHPLRGPGVRLSQLADASWIGPAEGSDCAALLDRSAGLAGFEPSVVGRCEDFAVALGLVAAGHGVALVPEIAAGPAEGTSVRLLTSADPPIRRTLYAAVRRGSGAHPAVACFLDALPTAPPLAAVGAALDRYAG